MLTTSLILLLLSNSTTLRRDKSILYSRATITILLIASLVTYDNLYLLFLNKDIGIFGSLYTTTSITNAFHLFILLISSIILLLTSFYPRKVWLKEYSYPDRLLFTKLVYYETIILNKMREQYIIIEYSLIILFIIIGGIFLISTSDLISIFLSVGLQSYGFYLFCKTCKYSEKSMVSQFIDLLLVGFFFLIKGLILLTVRIIYLVFNNSLLAYYLISLEEPKVHYFTYVCLKSSPPISEDELETFIKHKKECKYELLDADEALKTLRKALELDKIIPDKSKNRSMQEIMSHYKEFFDEDSGNNKQEGLKQLYKELSDDLKNKHSKYKKAKENLEQYKSNSQSIIFFLCRFNFISLKHILPYITFILSALSLLLTITSVFPDIYINVFLYIPDFVFDIRDYIQSIIKYEIILDLPTFIWSCYKLWQKTKWYIKIGNKIKDYIYNTSFVFLFFVFILLIIILLLFSFTPEELLNITNKLTLFFNLT